MGVRVEALNVRVHNFRDANPDSASKLVAFSHAKRKATFPADTLPRESKAFRDTSYLLRASVGGGGFPGRHLSWKDVLP
jgi:hypothetical protein